MGEAEAILEALNDAVFVADATTGVLVHCNRRAEELIGRPREQIVGLHQAELHPAGHREYYRELFRNHVERGRAMTVAEEAFVEHRDGRRIPVEISAWTGESAGRRIITGVFRDISARRALEEARRRTEEQFRRIADALPVYLSYVGTDQRFRFANRHHESRFGPVDALAGRHVRDVLGDEIYDQLRPWILRALRGEPVTFETATGAEYARVSYVPDQAADGTVKGFFAAAIEITDSKRREQDRLERARRQRDALVREVHHRIRNHLQGVVGMLRRQASLYPAAAVALEQAIERIGAVALIHGLQERERTGGLPLGELVRAIADSSGGGRVAVNVPLPERRARLDDAETVPVALVLNEIVTNALKHGDGRAQVDVRVSDTEMEASVQVGNRGRGLPDRFDWRRGRGLGTGLELVRSLLPRKGASLTFRRQGSGVVVELTLTAPTLAVDRPEGEDENGDDSRSPSAAGPATLEPGADRDGGEGR